jgi:YD repeat-containing protein
MDSNSKPENLPLSEREQHGLRGPVRVCIEEITYPRFFTADGTQRPESKTLHTTEYDIEGRILAARWRNSNGSEWANHYTYTYNAGGQLLKTVCGNESEPPSETVYVYDDQERLQSITDRQNPANPVTFRYDEHGRKTKVQVSRPEDYRPNLSTSGDSPFWSADMPPNLQGGGSALTIYDEHDRPTQVQVRDSQGELISRAVRTYDAHGRIAEEKLIHDDLLTIFPADLRTRILETPGASLEEVREQLKKLMGGQAGPSSVAFSYDAQGRITQKTRRVFNSVDRIEITYNQQGDKILEITRTTQEDRPEQYSEGHVSYQYDSHGNWTEKLDSYCSIPGGTQVTSTRTLRTLEYF